MLGTRVFVFYVESFRVVLGASGPGLDWGTALGPAIRAYYGHHGAVQARWVQVLGASRVERTRTYERWAVVTSRDEMVAVFVRELGTKGFVDEDPPEVLVAVEERAITRRLLAATLNWTEERASA